MLVAFLARTQEPKGKAAEGQLYSQKSSSTKNHHNFHCMRHSCYKSSKGCARVLTTTFERGNDRSGSSNFSCSLGPQPHHPYNRQIKAIITQIPRCFPRFRDFSILDRPCWRSFEGGSFSPSKLKILSF